MPRNATPTTASPAPHPCYAPFPIVSLLPLTLASPPRLPRSSSCESFWSMNQEHTSIMIDIIYDIPNVAINYQKDTIEIKYYLKGNIFKTDWKIFKTEPYKQTNIYACIMKIHNFDVKTKKESTTFWYACASLGWPQPQYRRVVSSSGAPHSPSRACPRSSPRTTGSPWPHSRRITIKKRRCSPF